MDIAYVKFFFVMDVFEGLNYIDLKENAGTNNDVLIRREDWKLLAK